ncbi:response regulator transcription factor [Pseudomonas sp. R81]|uniref:response regulator transcription factor n=1 Tax=Pseudomonas sp. R81 TaxID=1144885 RepID=UPI00029ABD78|nr:response regulator [Pseudomonas sp. R81]
MIVCSPNLGLKTQTSAPSIGIIDDDLAVRRSLANLLKSAGYRASTFASGEEFLQSLSEPGPDCVLIDSRMKGMQGIEVQRFLKLKGAAPAMVCMSAFWNDVTRAEAYLHGAHQCLSKPFTEELLLATIEDALSSK